MKVLTKSLFDKISEYMNEETRPLEKALFNFYFNNSQGKEILDTLEEFQNKDGGFGCGIEPDFKLVESSPMATSIGLRHLNLLDGNERAHVMIAKAIEYLENTFDRDRNGWFSVPREVNDYPHAPWWEFKDDINMTVIDYSWGNPTAEIIGYLYKYRQYINKLDIDSLLNFAIKSLNERIEFKSEHELFCYIHLYNILDKEFKSKLEQPIKTAVSQLININEPEWKNYVPTPLRFINFDSQNYFEIKEEYINQNLDYIINKLEEKGKLLPTWQWGTYQEHWEIAKKEWIGILTLEGLLSLLKFGRTSIYRDSKRQGI
ncbi:hypothetical protein SH2C18_04220 [Clostridium sediminicola]|uniref:hypothetical protein n=1 Tax=Clostridium sediminicola TaxID=3114879 RepID=UPI0031F20DCF